MMAEQVIHEMISAFAVGCMDKENYINFKDYIDSDGELPYRELGELQSLISMIPLLLELELPDIKLKDNVAKKLITMQGEIKAKLKEDKTKTALPRVESSPGPETIQKSKVTKEFITEAFEKSNHNKEIPQKKSKVIERKLGSSIIMWIGFAFILLLLIVTAYSLYDMNKSLNTEVVGLRNEISLLQDDISSNRDFIKNYNLLIEFFSYKDIAVIDLSPAEEKSAASGKLFISYGQLKGLLELNNLPSISPEEAYQLWVVSKGISYSLGVFRPSIEQRYFEISKIPYISKEDFELARITIEPRNGSSSPEGQTQLFGVIVEKPVKKRR